MVGWLNSRVPGFFKAALNDCYCCQESSEPGQCQSSCQKCRPGHFQPKNSSTSCLKCPIGYNSSQTGCKQCYPCPSGTETKDTGMSQCVDCNPGFYKATDNVQLCIPCSAGWYQLGYGSEECTQCPAGNFCPCATCEPKKCKPEQYCPAGSSEPSTCGDINLYYKDPNTQACRPTVLLIALIAGGCAACLALITGAALSVYCKKTRLPKVDKSSAETHRLLGTEEKSEEPVYQGL
uniref:Tyrosine-protein kinase ephrin type A/B receptor-like domain-containing protein n=1 Tax=Branchiostoma floridae TaxID=7739 RepID=C3Y4A3_BRAFL|eukprot:XP_002609119.1 hypothetical protein BRAFLDRAFT_126142 [Branchiostoma floridae]